MAPRVVAAPAALEMLTACGCRDYGDRAPITESTPAPVCGGEASASAVSPPLIAATVARTIVVVRSIGCFL